MVNGNSSDPRNAERGGKRSEENSSLQPGTRHATEWSPIAVGEWALQLLDPLYERLHIGHSNMIDSAITKRTTDWLIYS